MAKSDDQMHLWRIHSCLADTARNQGSFTTYVLWSVKSFNSPTRTVHINLQKHLCIFDIKMHVSNLLLFKPEMRALSLYGHVRKCKLNSPPVLLYGFYVKLTVGHLAR